MELQSTKNEATTNLTNPINPFLQRRKRRSEWFIERGITVVAGVSIALIFLILSFVMREALPLFLGSGKAAQTNQQRTAEAALRPEVYNPDVTLLVMKQQTTSNKESSNKELSNKESSNEKISAANILSTTWQPVSSSPKFGIMPLIVGTAKTTIVAILIGAPLGILAALYAAFLAPKRIREFIKPMVEILAAFPSVVIGFFCLLALGSLMQSLFGLEYRLNAFVGGLGLAIAVIPIVFTITEDALSAVPKTLLEASLAMGSSTWEAAYKVMLPAAFPGVFAAVLLGIGRAFGETMIALMATGNAALFSASFTDPARTLSATIGAEMGEVIWGSAHYNILFFLGILLFVVSLILNAVTEFFVKERLAKKLQGS